MAVDTRAAYANLLLPSLLRERGLSGRDAAFATDLTYTSLRWRGLADAVVEHAAGRAVSAIDVHARNVLRLATTSWLVHETAPHAVVATAVDLARAIGADRRGQGFVNAVLRRVTERSATAWRELLAETRTSTRDLAVAYSHPEWIVDALREALIMCGRDPADITALLEADNAAVAATLAARPHLCDVTELLTEEGAQLGRWASTAVHLAGGDPGRIAAVREHRAGVQDEGSQLVALIAAGLRVEGQDSRWLDACAGPGGKAAMLAALAAERGARVTAVEPQAHRAELVRTTLKQLTNVDVVTADSTQLGEQSWYHDAMFDRVLVDVPCSGLGALRRRPDLRWHRQQRDVADIGSLQEALLRAAAVAVRPGGILAYSTCSPHVAETVVVTTRAVRALAAQGVHLVHVDLSMELDQVPRIHGAALSASNLNRASLQLWPDVHGTDAMYLTAWRRR